MPADSRCQPLAPLHSSPPRKAEHSCCCESQDMAFSLGIWLPKSGLAGVSFRGSRHRAQLAPEETEVCRQDEQPRPRCADAQSPVCSERDSIQTRAGSQPAIQRSSPWQTRAGGSTAWHRPGKGWRSQAPPVLFRCSQTPLQPPGVVPSVLLCYRGVGLSQPISEPHRVTHSISTTQLRQHGAGN